MIKAIIDVVDAEVKELEKEEDLLMDLNEEIIAGRLANLEDTKQILLLFNQMEQHYINLFKAVTVAFNALNDTREAYVDSLKEIKPNEE